MNKLSLGDRMWLRLCKKPYSKTGFYLTATIPWLPLGMIYLMTIALTAGTIAGDGSVWWPILGWAYCIAVTITFIRLDHKRGYADALYNRYLERREERMAKINAKLTKEVQNA